MGWREDGVKASISLAVAWRTSNCPSLPDPIQRSAMANDPIDTRTGSRTTRLGLMGFGFVIGVIVTLILVFAFELR